MEGIRILIYVKEAGDRAIIRWALEKSKISLNIDELDHSEALFPRISQENYQCIISDHTAQSSHGIQVWNALMALHTTVPLVLLVDANHHSMLDEDNPQSRVSICINKIHLSPENLGRDIQKLIVIQTEIERSNMLERALTKSMDRLQAFYTNFSVAIFELDKKGVIISIDGKILPKLGLGQTNQSGQNHTGQEYTGRYIWDILPDHFRIKDALYHALTGEYFELKVTHKELFLETRYFPLRDNNQQIIGVTCFFVDITPHVMQERKWSKMEDEITRTFRQKLSHMEKQRDGMLEEIKSKNKNISENEKTLRTLKTFLNDLKIYRVHLLSSAEGNPISVYFDDPYADHHLTISIMQDGQYHAEKILNKEDLVGLKAAITVASNINKELHTRFRANLAGKWLGFECKAIVLERNAEYVLWQGIAASLSLIENENEFMFANDFYTQQKSTRQIQKLEEERDAALEEVKIKSQFLTGMSEEIRVTIENLLGVFDLLFEEDLSPEQMEYAEMVHLSAHGLITITNDIKDFSALENNTVELSHTDFDIRTLVEDVYALFANVAQERHTQFNFLIPYHIPQRLLGDPGRIRQILTNLVDHAVSNNQGGEVLIKVFPEQDQQKEPRMRIEVYDSAAKVTAQQRKYLFHFFHDTDMEAQHYHNAGLRLTVSRQLVEMMGGELGLTNQGDEGAVFWFSLPYQPLVDHMAQSAPALQQLRGLRSMIISRNKSGIHQLMQWMDSWDMFVTYCGDGDQALEALLEAAHRQQKFDMVILDGYVRNHVDLELARIIKNDSALGNIRIVLLTHVAHRGDSTKAIEAGINGFLTKPIRESLLFDCLRTVMGLPVHSPAYSLVTKHSIADVYAKLRGYVLIVMDNEAQLKKLHAGLQRLGFRTDYAASGIEALDALATIGYDLVVMSPHLPLMDGLSVMREIRRREQSAAQIKHVPVLGVLLQESFEEYQKCINAGMDGVFVMDADLAGLDALLVRWIKLKNPEMPIQEVHTQADDQTMFLE